MPIGRFVSLFPFSHSHFLSLSLKPYLWICWMRMEIPRALEFTLCCWFVFSALHTVSSHIHILCSRCESVSCRVIPSLCDSSIGTVVQPCKQSAWTASSHSVTQYVRPLPSINTAVWFISVTSARCSTAASASTSTSGHAIGSLHFKIVNVLLFLSFSFFQCFSTLRFHCKARDSFHSRQSCVQAYSVKKGYRFAIYRQSQ